MQGWVWFAHEINWLTWAEKRRDLPGDAPYQAIMHRSVYERFDAIEVLQHDVEKPYRPVTLSKHVDFVDGYQGGVRNPNPVAMAMYVEERLNRRKSDEVSEEA